MSRIGTLLDDIRGVALMGILNRTPDSFSDGGRYVDDRAASEHLRELVRQGAHIVDIGAESTRPGSHAVSDDEQIARLGGAVEQACALGVLVSIDTTSPVVAEHALALGASIVNSTSLEAAAELGAVAARHGAALVLMHCRGSMTAMRGFSAYDERAYGDVVADVARELGAAAERAFAAGLPRRNLLIDPGLGFTKNARHSIELCARLDELCALGFPVVVGPSRKSFLAAASGESPAPGPLDRLGGTIAASLACADRGAAVLRVHDVGPVRQALAVRAAIEGRSAPRAQPASPHEEVRHA